MNQLKPITETNGPNPQMQKHFTYSRIKKYGPAVVLVGSPDIAVFDSYGFIGGRSSHALRRVGGGR